MTGSTISVPKATSLEILTDALEHARTVSLATAASLESDARELQAQAELALAVVQASEPRPLTARQPQSRLFARPFYTPGSIEGQRDAHILSGTAVVDAQALTVNSDVTGGAAQGVQTVLGPFSEGISRVLIDRTKPTFVLQWGIDGSSGYRYAVWSAGTNIECGHWHVRPDGGLDEVTSIAQIAMPGEDFYVETMVGPSFVGGGFGVRVWGASAAKPSVVSAAVGFGSSTPLLGEGALTLASLGQPARYKSHTIDDWSARPNPLTAKVSLVGRWFNRFEAAVNCMSTSTSGSELRMVVQGTPGVGLLLAIPTGMSYRPVVAARWREFGVAAAWAEWVRTQVPATGGAGSIVRVDPVTGLQPLRRYEVQLCFNIHEADQHWVFGSGACAVDVLVATGGTCSPYVNPLARWLEADGDSITAGVAALPYPPSGPPSQPSNLVSERAYLHVACDLLGAVPIHTGFGGTGVLVPGSGGAPDARRHVFEYMNGRARRGERAPDVILMTHGTNDAGAANRTPAVNISSGQFRAGYGELMERRRAFSPSSALIAVRPFNGSFWPEIQDVARAMSLPTIDTTGWLDPTDYTDGTHPTADTGHLKGGTRLAAALTDLFGAGYW